MSGKLLIIGAGGHGRVVADAATGMNKWNTISFVDSKYPVHTKSGRWEIVGTNNDIKDLLIDYDSAIVAIGDNLIRIKLINFLKEIGCNIASVIHSSAQIGSEVSIGKGTVILANAVINHGTTIGNACIVNTAATVDHDNKIGECVHLSPGVNLGGGVTIGASSWIGIGASVIHNCNIGKSVTVGAGSVVIDNIADNLTVVGSPSKSL
jgi:sugar O-acyltransferase (sialic acid O-acetyltransferase NeuD family)